MVYFTCNHCGDSLPKPKVEKHYQTACSRNPIDVTCFDCHKDFRENAYVSHTKCVTEMERYSDKNYVAKPNKGEQKQSAWIDAVQSVISDTVNAKPAVKDILRKIASHDNVPRKKVKFMNFMRNCGGIRTKDDILEEVWSLLETKLNELKSDNNKSNDQAVEKKEDVSAEDEKPAENGKEKKKKRKLEESEQPNKEENLENGDAEKMDSETVAEEEIESPKKKQKKQSSPVDEKVTENGKEKKKKTKLEENEPNQEVLENGKAETNDLSLAEESNENSNKKADEQISKFEWKKEIINCLNSNDNEISMKKLRKNLIESYIAAVDFDKYFMKKLNKIKGLTIKDDIVKLDN